MLLLQVLSEHKVGWNESYQRPPGPTNWQHRRPARLIGHKAIAGSEKCSQILIQDYCQQVSRQRLDINGQLQVWTACVLHARSTVVSITRVGNDLAKGDRG